MCGWGLSLGRVSALLQRRADELGINPVVQGREDKLTALDELLETMEIGMDEIAFMGDDLPDLAVSRCVRVWGLPQPMEAAHLAQQAHWQTARTEAGMAQCVRWPR